MDWSLIILNNSEEVVRTFSDSGTTGSVLWDGKNDAGVTQVPGEYRFELSSTAGAEVAAPVAGIITLDYMSPIPNFSVSPSFFSPNGDLIQDTATASASFTSSANWTLEIKNSGNITVSNASGQGSSFSYIWNGSSQPDGIYTAYLSVTIGSLILNDSRIVTLDNTFPTAVITSPTSSQILSNVYQNGSSDVPIVGTASDTNINNWSLERGSGPTPSVWFVFATGTANVTNSTIAPWPTLALTNGVHTIRLKVFDKAGNTTTSTSVTVTISNFSLSQNKLQISTSTSESVTYTSNVPFPLTQTLLIKDLSGQTVKTIFNGQRSTAGSYPDTWAGLNEAGSALVADSAYKVIANITSGTYSMTWDQSSEFISGEREYHQHITTGSDPFNNDPPNFIFSNTLKPGKALLICSTECSPSTTPPVIHFNADDDCVGTTACPVQYEYFPAGSFEASWAGTDTTGVYRDYCGCVMYVEPNTFSQNNILLFGRQPKVTNLTVTPPLYAPEKGNQTISFTLATFQNQQANITITILNQSSVSVLRNITQNNVNPGTVNIQWDGRADNAMRVAPGNYTITVIATTPTGQSRKTQILSTIQY